MNTTKKYRLAAMPALVAAMAAPFLLATGCDGENPLGALCCEDFKPGTNMLEVDWGLEGSLNADFGVAIQAIGDFQASVTALMTDLGAACRGMAVELGEDPNAVTTADPAQYTEQWCALAATAVGNIQGSITVSVQPAQCSFSAEVQASCEGSCQVDASCDPGGIEARCDPGELSVKCEGSCSGKCEGSANVAVSCTGACEGTCEGTCDGQAQPGGGSGSCAGTCEGKCRGSCTAEADANIACEGECTGGCEGTATAPKCKAELTPPACEASAECQASCKGSASAKAECTPPAVDVTISGNAEATVAVLEKYLPQIYGVVEGKGKLLLDNAGAIVEVSGNLSAALEGDGKAVFCIIPAGQAIADAAANIQVSVSAAVNVTAAVGG